MSSKKKTAQKAGEKKGISSFAMVMTAFAVVIVAILVINKMNAPEPSVMMQQTAGESGSSNSSSSAPDFSLASVGGGSKSLSDYKGKVVMLNFWATWCGPCKREIPDFIAMQKAYRDKGFEIVGISLDDPTATAQVAQFVKQQGINYDIVYGNGEVAQAYGGVQSIPTTFLIDREGKVVSSKVGLQTKEAWESAIEALL
ncbi:MAG: TlpA family protein disulfide reductase [Bacteroidetes bacterium]|nr:TlpA family protein disulfide reductase [Bacteroidota bacterium]